MKPKHATIVAMLLTVAIGGFSLAIAQPSQVETAPTATPTPVIATQDVGPTVTAVPTLVAVPATASTADIASVVNNHETRIAKLETSPTLSPQPTPYNPSVVCSGDACPTSTGSGHSAPATRVELAALYAGIGAPGEKQAEKYAACLAWPMSAYVCQANQDASLGY